MTDDTGKTGVNGEDEGGAMTDDTGKTGVNGEGAYEPFRTDDVPWVEHTHGARYGTRYRELGEFGGCSHVGVSIEEVPPGRQNYPMHYHMLEEEHLLALEGTATLRLGSHTYELAPGSYVVFPAGQKVGHAVINTGDAPFRYLIIGERDDREVVVYPDFDRVGVRLMDAGYRGSATMGYWEGEPAEGDRVIKD
jgi:uncharacterized cupin superfamily protein